jgi:hypothetical protein
MLKRQQIKALLILEFLIAVKKKRKKRESNLSMASMIISCFTQTWLSQWAWPIIGA